MTGAKRLIADELSQDRHVDHLTRLMISDLLGHSRDASLEFR